MPARESAETPAVTALLQPHWQHNTNTNTNTNTNADTTETVLIRPKNLPVRSWNFGEVDADSAGEHPAKNNTEGL